MGSLSYLGRLIRACHALASPTSVWNHALPLPDCHQLVRGDSRISFMQSVRPVDFDVGLSSPRPRPKWRRGSLQE